MENPHIHLMRIIRQPKNFYFTCKHIFNIELAPFQVLILQEMWHRKYPMLIATRGGSKSWLLALYSMLYALINQGSKIVIVGAAFRQAKVVFEYGEFMWRNAPILRDIIGDVGKSGETNGPRRDIDRCTIRLGQSLIIALPLGNGSKIRGQRAQVIITDEFHAVPKNIYEEVVSGFAATRASPIESMKHAARVRVLKKQGRWTSELDEHDKSINRGNQAIIAGTANYTFNHFYEYWKQHKAFIESRGDVNKLLEVTHGRIPPKFNYKNYSIIRLPVELLPEDFMDEEHVARHQMTTNISTYGIEYGAVFAGDSDGFYRRSIIEGCTVKPDTLHDMLDGVTVFHPRLRGDPNLQYIFSVDTASEHDNFAITIVELHSNHQRTIYCWTTNRERHIERVRYGIVKEKNFYAYAARKIRDLMKVFNCIHISMDSQGGGRAVLEALHDMDKIEKNEVPIWEVKSDDPSKPGSHDNQAGLHIVELVNFADGNWVSNANHGLKKDMEDRLLLFPYFDPIKLYEANKEDKALGRIKIKDGEEIQLADTLEELVMEIELLKDELTTIVHTQTGIAMRDHWDVPAIKEADGRKGRLRKDRYSALLMANMAARSLIRAPEPIKYSSTAGGGFAKDIAEIKPSKEEVLWAAAPSWFTNSQGSYYGGVVVQRKS